MSQGSCGQAVLGRGLEGEPQQHAFSITARKGKKKEKVPPLPNPLMACNNRHTWILQKTRRSVLLSMGLFSEEELVLSVDHYTANAAGGNLWQSIIFASAAVFNCSISASLPTCTEVTIHPQPVHNWPVASLPGSNHPASIWWSLNDELFWGTLSSSNSSSPETWRWYRNWGSTAGLTGSTSEWSAWYATTLL